MDNKTCQQFRGAIINRNAKQLARLIKKHPDCFDTSLVSNAGESTPQIVKMLLEAGWDVNAQAEGPGTTLLMYAAQAGKPKIVELLIESGVDVNATDHHGEIPVNAACSRTAKGNVASLRLLLDTNASLEVREGRYSSLMVACAYGNTEMVEMLLNAGVSVSEVVKNPTGTALAAAILENRPEIVEFLLEHSADPNHRFPDDFADESWAGKTELEIARELKRKKIVGIIEAFLSGETVAEADITVTEAWQRLKQTLVDAGEKLSDCFRRKATKKQFQMLADGFPVAVPKDLEESLAFCNGQPELGMYFGLATDSYGLEGPNLFRILSVKEMLEERVLMLKYVEEGVFDGEPSVEKGIRETFWDERWLPIGKNYVGNLLAYDFHPDKGGKVGQILHYNHETWGYSIAATSLASLLRDFEVVTFPDD